MLAEALLRAVALHSLGHHMHVAHVISLEVKTGVQRGEEGRR